MKKRRDDCEPAKPAPQPKPKAKPKGQPDMTDKLFRKLDRIEREADQRGIAAVERHAKLHRLIADLFKQQEKEIMATLSEFTEKFATMQSDIDRLTAERAALEVKIAELQAQIEAGVESGDMNADEEAEAIAGVETLREQLAAAGGPPVEQPEDPPVDPNEPPSQSKRGKR